LPASDWHRARGFFMITQREQGYPNPQPSNAIRAGIIARLDKPAGQIGELLVSIGVP
jgi:hypothetical protein